MANIGIGETEGLTARDVIHPRMTASDADAPVGALRAWFDASGSRRLAVLVDATGNYVGVVTPDDLPDDDGVPAREVARSGVTVHADSPADLAGELAREEPSRRVPVVDDEGTLLGVVALDEDRTRFCGTTAGT
ncbi:CBS domain-containing protein [Paraconexibacter sp.]|uniref:CBS domain-containing protein n=1 Tax=Paraconexibacter sp. TaxID=2949640 RepID=UPI00356B40EB